MAARNESLTGIWHGLYTYVGQPEPVYFVATLLHSGTHLSGTTHESERGETGAPLTLFAMIEGAVHGEIVTFTKAYNGSGGWAHSVVYDGALNPDRTEIEGAWVIDTRATGRFLMIRSSGASEKAVRKAFAKA